jgi:DNA-binding NarL/FixJ family response regulator
MAADMTEAITVIIADDHPVFRKGLRHALEAVPDFAVVGEAGDGGAGLELVRSLRPRVAVLDIDMPTSDGFAVARALAAEGSATEIVFLTVHRGEDLLEAALALGAKGYVLKDSAVTDIVSGVRAAAAGQHYVSPALTSFLVRRAAAPPAQQARPLLAGTEPGGLTALTPTELRVLKLIADYQTTKEIAAALHVSPRTVETHRANVCQKLGLHGSHALMKFALAHKDELR